MKRFLKVTMTVIVTVVGAAAFVVGATLFVIGTAALFGRDGVRRVHECVEDLV